MKNRAKPVVRTLADVLAEVEAGLGFDARRQRDITSDIRALAKLTGQPLETQPAEAGRLRAVFAALHPAQAQVSKKRLQNIRANVAAALQRVRYPRQSPLSTVPFAPAWQPLYAALPTERLKYALSGFLRYCSLHEIPPDAVRDGVVADYHRYLVDHSLKQHPEQVYRQTCRAWNDSREVAGWPPVTLAVPSFQRPTQTIPFEQFPTGFAAEVEDYLAWLAGKHLLADRQPPAVCRPSTVALRRRQIQQLASAAVHGGIAISELTSLRALVSRPVVEAAIRHHLARHDDQPTPYIRDLAKTLKRIAQHWVGVDEAELVWLRRLVRRLDTQGPGLTEKNRATLRQFDAPANLQRLLDLPDVLMRRAKSVPSPNKAAHTYLWGLVIEILTVAPMRIGNLAALRIDSHLVRPEGPRGPIILCLVEGETKNRRAHEYPLPAATARKLDHYLRQHRPHLIDDPDCPWLWPDRKGHHKSPTTMSERITKLIYRETGLHLTPHQFRHLAAKLILQARPGEFELARQVLGHRHTSTTIHFYAGMQAREAVTLYDEIVEQRRTPPKGKRR